MTRGLSTHEMVTELVLKTFRLHGHFLDAAERITEGSALTPARWQVLGAVLDRPLTVSDIARAMGLTRQGVQRLADALEEDGLCEYHENPAHRRANLVAPTEKGRREIDAIAPKQREWARRIGQRIGASELEALLAGFDRVLGVVSSAELVSTESTSTPKRRGPASER